MKMKKIGALILTVSLALTTLTACNNTSTPSTSGNSPSPASSSPSASDSTPAQSYELNFGCNSTGASFYQWAVQVSDIVNRNCENITLNAVSTAGGIENCAFMETGEMELGGVYNIIQLQYWDGSIPFDDIDISSLPISKMYNAYPTYWHIMVPANSEINCIADLEGKRIALNTKGSVGYTQALYHFEALGINILEYAGSISYLSAAEASEALQEGSIDAMFSGGGLGDATCTQLGVSQKGLKLIGYTDEEIALALENRPAELVRTIPAGSYAGIDSDVQTVGGVQLVCVRNDVPEDVVYEIVKAITEHHDQLVDAIPTAQYSTPENTVADLDDDMPLHPGAEKYFRELGLM